MTMPNTPIATNLHETLDVKVNLFPEITFNGILMVNKLPKTINLLFGKLIYSGSWVNTNLS
jgi:hypothetical protein